MGNEYEWGYNPLNDFLLQLLMTQQDPTDKKIKEGVDNNIRYILMSIGIPQDDLIYLSYEIKKRVGHFKVVANNILTAMWFSGFYPPDIDLIYNKKMVIFDNIKFTFNEKTKKLKWVEEK